MIVVVFEVTMKEGQAPRYFEMAAALRSEVEKIDGFISVERFQSLSTPGKYVSLQFWRDREAVDTWRRNGAHALAQRLGKDEIFAEFRITVAEALRSYTLRDRLSAETAR